MTTDGQQQSVPIPQVAFSGQLPSEIADLRSLQDDFEFARSCAAAYLNVGKAGFDKESKDVLCRALWSAGAISYRRAFTTGKAHLAPQKARLKIPDHWKDLLTPEQWKAHEEILEVANRHIAHRVGTQENINVVALLAPPPNPRGVAGVAAMSIRLGSPGDDRVRQLIELCNVLTHIVGKRAEELSNKFLEEVKGKDLDELYRLAD